MSPRFRRIAAAPRYGAWGLELKDMDTSVKPGDGFFEYAEGTWLKNHPIPADKTAAGYNYDLPDEIELQVRKMVEDAAANPDLADGAENRRCLCRVDGRGGDRARGLPRSSPTSTASTRCRAATSSSS